MIRAIMIFISFFIHSKALAAADKNCIVQDCKNKGSVGTVTGTQGKVSPEGCAEHTARGKASVGEDTPTETLEGWGDDIEVTPQKKGTGEKSTSIQILDELPIAQEKETMTQLNHCRATATRILPQEVLGL